MENRKPAPGAGALPMQMVRVDMQMVRVEHQFEAPLAYCATWLTDFRPDDGRLIGDETPMEVLRNGDVVTRRATTPMGPMTQVVTIESPRRWRVDGKQFSPDGTLLLGFTIVETLEPRGTGTRHTAEIVVQEAHKTMVAMLDQIKVGWNENVRTIFANVKPEIEAAFRRGVAADA